MPSDRSTPEHNGIITRRVTPGPVAENDADVISNTKHEEWTTSKKVVNHKTRQTETRVQRQVVLEDGKVIADSGPQITTRTTEDNKVEESEDTQHKKTGDDRAPDGYVPIPGSEKVVCEKTETHHVMKESKEENMKMHDERIRDLSKPEEIHRMALMVPGESPLVGISPGQYPGKVTHYSSRCKKVSDTDEVKEFSEQKGGEVTTQTTRTHHHEEVDDDEVPEDEAEGKGLPAIETETRRNYEYLHDGDEHDKLSDRQRKEKEMRFLTTGEPAERRDPVTRRALSLQEEEEIRNSVTNRWLEDHFGSDQSDDDPVRPHSGGNIINIRMTDKRTPTPPSRRDSPEVIYTMPYFKSPNQEPVVRESVSPYQPSTLQSSRVQKTSYHLGEHERNVEKTNVKNVWKSSPSIYHDLTRDLDDASSVTYRREGGAYKDLESSYRPAERSTIVGNSIFTREDRRQHHTSQTLDDSRIRRHDSFHQTATSTPKRPVHRSQSTRVPDRTSSQPTPHWTNFTLPRGPNGRVRTFTEYTSRTSRGVQADLEEPTITPTSRQTVRTVKETQSLPRHTHTHHHHRHHTHHQNHEERQRHDTRSPESNASSTMSRPSKTFYFGDKTDVSFHNKHRPNYFTIEKDRSVQPPRGFSSDRYYSVEDLTGRSYTNSHTQSVKKTSYQDRQRNVHATPPTSPPPRLIKVTNGRLSSPPVPPPPPPFQYEKLSRPIRTASPVVNPPTFTPLLSPTEIKRQQSSSMSNLSRDRYDTTQEYRTATSRTTKKEYRVPGPTVVEVRNWNNR
ncbi:uncharacterized protein LOC135371053 [Ornithodoros turicata]